MLTKSGGVAWHMTRGQNILVQLPGPPGELTWSWLLRIFLR